MERRKFLGWIGVGALASSLPMVIAACNGQTEDTTADKSETETTEAKSSQPREDGFTQLGTVEELKEKGQLEDKTFGVVVIRNPEDEALIALNPQCTHAGCPADWDAEAKLFACPCHGSKFKPDGEVSNGPAKEPLASYEVKEEEGLVLVKLS